MPSSTTSKSKSSKTKDAATPITTTSPSNSTPSDPQPQPRQRALSDAGSYVYPSDTLKSRSMRSRTGSLRASNSIKRSGSKSKTVSRRNSSGSTGSRHSKKEEGSTNEISKEEGSSVSEPSLDSNSDSENSHSGSSPAICESTPDPLPVTIEAPATVVQPSVKPVTQGVNQTISSSTAYIPGNKQQPVQRKSSLSGGRSSQTLLGWSQTLFKTKSQQEVKGADGGGDASNHERAREDENSDQVKSKETEVIVVGNGVSRRSTIGTIGGKEQEGNVEPSTKVNNHSADPKNSVRVVEWWKIVKSKLTASVGPAQSGEKENKDLKTRNSKGSRSRERSADSVTA
ncbi:hypothetical protein HDU76_001421 [Blyttiomyces sp. JEL0837]|nr:hypothetical protein HDU76_001421 [Blyttiomyces sp. JEL0837]